jgi:hypothetical protein
MKVLSRLAVAALLGCCLALGLVFLFTSFLSAASGCNVSEVARSLLQEMQRREQLENNDVAVLRSNHRRGKVTKQLLAGRLSLLEAAHEFGRADELLREETQGTIYTCEYTDEALCENVYFWAAAIARTSAERKVVAQLEEQMQQLFPIRAGLPRKWRPGKTAVGPNRTDRLCWGWRPPEGGGPSPGPRVRTSHEQRSDSGRTLCSQASGPCGPGAPAHHQLPARGAPERQ